MVPAKPPSLSVEGPRAQKRKRGKVPGVPQDGLDEHMANMRSQQQKDSTLLKKARLGRHTDDENLDIIEIDDEPISVNAAHAQASSHSQPRTSGHSRPSSPQLRSPPHSPPLRLRELSMAAAVPGPSNAGSRSASQVSSRVDIRVALQPRDTSLDLTSNAHLSIAAPACPPQPTVTNTPSGLYPLIDGDSSILEPRVSAAVPFGQTLADLGKNANALSMSLIHAVQHLHRYAEVSEERHQQVMQRHDKLDHRLTSVETEATSRAVGERRDYDAEIVELRAQCQQAGSDLLQAREELQKERSERSLMASKIRDLEEKLDRSVKAEDIGNLVQAQISTLMPTLRDSMVGMVQQGLNKYTSQQQAPVNFAMQHNQSLAPFPPIDGVATQPPHMNDPGWQVRNNLLRSLKPWFLTRKQDRRDHLGHPFHPHGSARVHGRQHPRVQLQSPYPNKEPWHYQNSSQHHYGNRGGPSGFGGQYNPSGNWQQNAGQPDGVNNWTPRGYNRPPLGDQQFDRERRQDEFSSIHRGGYQETSRDNDDEFGRRARSVGDRDSG